jgi:deazaflavin-dependent oxidoreductase (nitroreductase family)
MAEAGGWNRQIIAEYRATEGKLGGQFEGAPVVLLHHVGRRSGRPGIAPVMYLAPDEDPDTIYVFASKAGGPTNPDWYYNLTTAATATVEVGAQTYQVKVEEITGDARDRIFAEQSRRYPRFAGYAEQAAGIRTIPVLALRRTGDAV